MWLSVRCSARAIAVFEPAVQQPPVSSPPEYEAKTQETQYTTTTRQAVTTKHATGPGSDGVERLREEVQNLSVKRHRLCYGVQTKNNIWHVVVEYFRLFRYGYLAPMSELNLATSSPNDASTPREPNLRDQEWFLRAAMSPDVAIGELSGVDALIEQWRRYSTYFGRLHFQLKGMEEQPFGALVATASLSFTHRNIAAACVSASVSSFQRNAGWTRLLGRRLYCRCSVRFLWDDSTGRVTQLNCTMDFNAVAPGVW
ncbi:hypothetical protein GQ600_1298 [Phytophthora cactorum]|nr:hypothetical protein GQ600_1298 [Phytophthora cactorum]